MSVSAAAELLQRGTVAMGWTPIYGVGLNPLLVWVFASGALIGAGFTAHFVVRRWKEGIGQETLIAVLLLLAAARVPFMVLAPGIAYALVPTTLALALTVLVPRQVRPVIGALVVFISVVISVPMILLIREMLSPSAVWVTVFFAIVPVAPLALVLLQAGSRTTAWTSSSSDAVPDGAITTGRAVATAQDGVQEVVQEAAATSAASGPLLVSGPETAVC